MAVFEYKKYKISLDSDSKKIQGLKVGDIVRRQYFDGKNTIYSLLTVIDTGVDNSIVNEESIDSPYFIGALIEGDVPHSGELLDFARITNLFDTERLGAIYMTASDENAPYIDIVDGIGKNKSICWPESIAQDDYNVPSKQYVPATTTGLTCSYTEFSGENSRICKITKNTVSNILVGIKQDFEEFVENPDRVLISYKIRGNTNFTVKGKLGYSDWTRIDGEYSENVTTEWKYCFHAITIDWSGRHKRAFQLTGESLNKGYFIELADFNIILQSSVSNYQDASCGRFGKLDGIYDSVFGQLEGHGEYLQKIYASNSAHISGTLTAGDNNGFSSTFYAGKIHKNVWINSISPSFTSNATKIDMINPAGIGNVYSVGNKFSVIAQTGEWGKKHVGEKYALSFWLYVKNECTISLNVNGKIITAISIPAKRTESWKRYGCVVTLPNNTTTSLSFGANINFTGNPTIDAQTVLFANPQLEKGTEITQYQATDELLNETEDYGAWFNRGGIGGTIQNPLLKLNFDGEGSIGTSTNSFLLKNDGSGYFANKNIEWDANGKVVFGEDVTLSWGSIQDAPDWIYDWDSNKTLIGDEYIITPKLFAGKKDDDEKLTGVYIGPYNNGTGIYGYQNGNIVFRIDEYGGEIAGWVIDSKKICTKDLTMSINAEGSIISQDSHANILWGMYKTGEAIFSKGNVKFNSDGSGFIAGDKILWNAKGDLEIKAKVQIGEGSSGWENMSGLNEKLEEITETAQGLIEGIGIGVDNLLFNTGFTGNYDTTDLTPETSLKEDSKTYSYQLQYWSGTGKVVEDNESASKYACEITAISQNVQTLIVGENYVISYKAKGTNIVVNCGNAAFANDLTQEYQKFSHKFIHTGGTIFSLSGNATVCEIKLERGTIPTDWIPSSSDTDPTAANFKNYWYLLNALKGNTQILNGLTLTSMIQLGEWTDGVMKKVNAGISGIYNDDMDVAHWAGGSFEQAIKTVHQIIKGDTPTEEEWKSLAKFVVTHGGDVIIRGYIYALGGVFRGTVYAEDGVFNGTVYAKDGEFSGKIVIKPGSTGFSNLEDAPDMDAINSSIKDAQDAVDNLEEYVDGAFADGIISETEANSIAKYTNTINNTKASIDSTYNALYNNPYLSGTPKTNLLNAKTALNTAVNNLLNSIATAIKDGKTNTQEINDVNSKFTAYNSAISTFETAVVNANKAIQDYLKEYTNTTNTAAKDDLAKKIGYKDYNAMVSEANNGTTIIKNGLINTTLINAKNIVTSNLIAEAIVANGITIGNNTTINNAGIITTKKLVATEASISGKVTIQAGSTGFSNLEDAPDMDKISSDTKDDIAQKLGYVSYADMVSNAEDNTIIEGGYINTALIKAKAITADMIDATNLIANGIQATEADISGKIQADSGTLGKMTLKIETVDDGLYYKDDTKNSEMSLKPNSISAVPYNVFELNPSASQYNLLLALKRRRGNSLDRALYVEGVAEVYGRLGVGRGDNNGFNRFYPALVAEGISCYGQFCLPTKIITSTSSIEVTSSYVILDFSTTGGYVRLPSTNLTDGQTIIIRNIGNNMVKVYGTMKVETNNIVQSYDFQVGGRLHIHTYCVEKGYWIVNNLN